MSRKGRYKVTATGVVWHTVMAEHGVIEQLKPFSIAANVSLRDYLTRLIQSHVSEHITKKDMDPSQGRSILSKKMME